jgi:hypothetical protein
MRAAIIALPLLLLSACDHGSEAKPMGEGTQRSFEVGSFDRISLAGPHDVIVTVGGSPSVRAVGDSATLDKLQVRIDNGELILGNRNQSGFSFSSNRHKATFYVTVPSLAAAAVAGSGDMKVDKVAGPRFDAAIGGSGDLDVAAIKADEVGFSVAGSGGLRAAGAAQKSKVSIAGSGSLDAPAFQTADVTVSIAGSGSAQLKATGNADVTILGSGSVEIRGGARCNVSKLGSGHADCA